MGLVHPSKFSDFYLKYHGVMHAAGIDGVKVDNQVFFILFSVVLPTLFYYYY